MCNCARSNINWRQSVNIHYSNSLTTFKRNVDDTTILQRETDGFRQIYIATTRDPIINSSYNFYHARLNYELKNIQREREHAEIDRSFRSEQTIPIILFCFFNQRRANDAENAFR